MSLEKYYIMQGRNSNKYPMISGKLTHTFENRYCEEYYDADGNIKFINNHIKRTLVLGDYQYEANTIEPIPKKPEYVDIHNYDFEHTVSKNFVNVFKDTPGIQFLKVNSGTIVNDLGLDYYYLFALNYIKCMDIKHSKASVSSSGRIISVKKLYLDHKILSEIPLKHRLIFNLWEDASTFIVHQDFLNLYHQSGLKGFAFKPIEDYKEIKYYM